MRRGMSPVAMPPGALSTTGAHDATVIALVTHARSVPSRLREAFASELAALGEGPGHIVVHTCHRVEVLVAPATFRDDLPALPAGGELLEDVAAARHLISVACGLDSAILGDAQILHQLRETIAERQGDRAVDPVLDRLFQAALHAGRTARSWFTGPPRSLADVALDRIARAEGSLEGRRILVVGVGTMGRLAAFAAMRRGCSVVVTNRSPERAMQLAREVGGTAIPFGIDGGLEGVDGLAGVITAIDGRWRIGPADAEALIGLAIPVVDLSSPPSVPDALQQGLGERSISVDELTDDDHRLDERVRRRLEHLISETGRDYCQWLRTRDAVPAIQAVVSTAEEHRHAEVEWLRQRMPALAAEDLRLVEQMSHRLVASILHSPLAALSGDSSGDLERAARELFGV
jgi:glutamyl-tRNA reductase